MAGDPARPLDLAPQEAGSLDVLGLHESAADYAVQRPGRDDSRDAARTLDTPRVRRAHRPVVAAARAVDPVHPGYFFLTAAPAMSEPTPKRMAEVGSGIGADEPDEKSRERSKDTNSIFGVDALA